MSSEHFVQRDAERVKDRSVHRSTDSYDRFVGRHEASVPAISSGGAGICPRGGRDTKQVPISQAWPVEGFTRLFAGLTSR